MQLLEVSCAVRHIYTSLGAKGLSRGGIHPRIFNFLVALRRGSVESSAGVDAVHILKF